MSGLNWKELRKAAEELGKEYVKELAKQIIKADKSATGRLIKSLHSKVISGPFFDTIKIDGESYLRFVDKGRRPGSKPPPVSKIMKWMDARGIKGRDKKTGKFIPKRQAAFMIARSIGKKGFRNQPTNVIKKAMDLVLRRKVTKTLKDAAAKDAERETFLMVKDILEKRIIKKK